MAPDAADALTRFVFEGAAVRGAHVRLDRAARDILACHPYPPALARALAELLGAAALLASTLKFRGSLTVQLSGDGPVRLLVVECNDRLELRATAQWDAAATGRLAADATLAALAGDPDRARLCITLDPDNGPIYQGIVALEATSVAALVSHYLEASEQIGSRLALATRNGSVAGLLVQRLPASGAVDDSTWQVADAGITRLDPAALLRARTAEEALRNAFPEADLRVFRPKHPAFCCPCSRERVENALRIAGRAEIEAALEERGEVEVTCEFCNRRYTFPPAEARAVFPGAATATATRH